MSGGEKRGEFLFNCLVGCLVLRKLENKSVMVYVFIECIVGIWRNEEG